MQSVKPPANTVVLHVEQSIGDLDVRVLKHVGGEVVMDAMQAIVHAVNTCVKNEDVVHMQAYVALINNAYMLRTFKEEHPKYILCLVNRFFS